MAPTALADVCRQGSLMLPELTQYEWCCEHMVTVTEGLKANLADVEAAAIAENPQLFQAVAG